MNERRSNRNKINVVTKKQTKELNFFNQIFYSYENSDYRHVFKSCLVKCD